MPLPQQKAGVADQLPFTLATLHRQLKQLQTTFAVAAGGGFGNAIAPLHMNGRPQPEQAVEGLQHGQLNQGSGQAPGDC